MLLFKNLTLKFADWDGSDAEYGSSEPMDSIAELCGNVTDDLDS